MSEKNRNVNYTEEEINSILNIIKDCISCDRCIIATQRDKYRSFINRFGLRRRKIFGIISRLSVDDFCYSTQNIHPGFEHEVLYVFAPNVALYDLSSIKQNVIIYIKFNIVSENGQENAIVISFHEAEHDITYAFK